MKRYQSVVATAPPPTLPQRRVASRAPAVASEVLVPSAAAIVSGLFAGAFSAVVWGWMGGTDALGMFAQVALLTGAPLWFVLLLSAWRMLDTVEEQPGAEAAEVAQMPATRPVVRVAVESEHTIRNADLDATDSQLAQLAEGLLAGKALTEAQWTGAGRPFSVDQFREIRAEMQGAGLIRPKSEKDARQGFSLTPSGRAAMKRLVGGAADDTQGTS